MADQDTQSCITYPLNGIEYTAEDAELYCCTRTSGVYSSEYQFEVTRLDWDGRIVVGPGLAWINNKEYAGKVVKHTWTDITDLITPAIVNDKYYRVVLRFDSLQNRSYITVIEGEEAIDPRLPDIVRDDYIYDLGVAGIHVRTDGIWTPVDIFSTILDEDVCGIMRDGVTGIPTNDLYRKFEVVLDDMRETISRVEAGTDVMLQSLFNPEGKTGQVQMADETGKALYVDLRNYGPGDSVPAGIMLQLSANVGNASIYAIIKSYDGVEDVYIPLAGSPNGASKYVFSGWCRNHMYDLVISDVYSGAFVEYVGGNAFAPDNKDTSMTHPVGVDNNGKLWSTSSRWFTGTSVYGTGSSISADVPGANEGDMYLNTTTGYVYKALSSTTWKYIMKLKGENGTNGKDGKDGKDGEDGDDGTYTYEVVRRTGRYTITSGAYTQIAHAVSDQKMIVLRDNYIRSGGMYVEAKYTGMYLDLDGDHAVYEFAAITLTDMIKIKLTHYRVFSDNHVEAREEIIDY